MNIGKLVYSLFSILVFGTAMNAGASTQVMCPDLKHVIRVGQCPSEDELKYTFNGYCSDDSRIYGKGAEVCANFHDYRQMKNTARWESKDGEFESYVSCDLPEARLRAMRATSITASKDKKIERLKCGYDEGVHFTRRSHETCKIESPEACRDGSAVCQAECSAP